MLAIRSGSAVARVISHGILRQVTNLATDMAGSPNQRVTSQLVSLKLEWLHGVFQQIFFKAFQGQ